MFHKTRNKITLSILIMTALFSLMTFSAIYFTSYRSLVNQSDEMLEKYMENYSPYTKFSTGKPDLPVNPDDLKEDGHMADGMLDQLSSFYSVAFNDVNGILSVDKGWNNLHSEEEIIKLAQGMLASDKSSGTYEHMLYRIDKRDGYTLVAFMDTLLMEESMRTVLISTVIVGIVALCLFFIASIFLSKRIVKPLEENDRRQKQFVSDAGHELKTPISVISTNAELLSREIGDNKWLSNIQYENDKMAELIKELLVLSRAENGAFTFSSVNLSKLVQKEAFPFESIAYEKGSTLNITASDNTMVNGGEKQLGQLISILIDNAISYSTDGTEINISLKKSGRVAKLSVENTGSEIPEDAKKRLFDRFYRTDESRSEEENHFGLGLPIAKAIVDAHKGDINVDCKDNKVIFIVTLPLN